MQQLYLVLLAGGLVLLASIVATRAATRVGLPSLLLFLGVGVIVGEDGLGLQFENYLLADHLGTVALAIILIEGGLTTKFADVRRVLAPAGMLATLGVAVSMVITAAGRTCCSGWTGNSHYCSAPSCPPPTPPPCSPCCASCPCRGGSPACSRPSPDSTTRRPSSSC